MGHRTLKRVPLNFSWPLGKVWKGYVNPNPGPRECRLCSGWGYNKATCDLAEKFYDHKGYGSRWYYIYYIDPNGNPTMRPPWMIRGRCYAWSHDITQDEVEALVTKNRLFEFTRVPINERQRAFLEKQGGGYLPFFNGYMPTAAEVNAWSYNGMGHDALNRWILIETRAKRLGIWGHCRKCKGKGQEKLPRKMKKAYKQWHTYEPPQGEGWQLWETCTEGSPISPVFATPEELATWCEENATIFGSFAESREGWLSMFVGDVESVETESMILVKRPRPTPPTEATIH